MLLNQIDKKKQKSFAKRPLKRFLFLHEFLLNITAIFTKLTKFTMLPTKLIISTLTSVTRFSNSISSTINTVCKAVTIAIQQQQQPPQLDWALAPVDLSFEGSNKKSTTKWTAEKAKELLDEIFDSLLWAVPKRRVSVFVRRRRRMGVENYTHGSFQRRKENIVTCHVCGNFMEPGFLCEHCYQENCKETKLIQEAMIKEYGFKPIEEAVLPLYEGEEQKPRPGFKFVPIEKKRPQWFSPNLISRPTAHSEEGTKDVIEVTDHNKK